MNKQHAFTLAACIALVAGLASSAGAAAPKSPPNMPTAAEQPFVARATAEMQKMYGTTADAKNAGYFRYNDEDETGAISWINLKYWNSDETHPNQLWYDAKGNLIGIDYTKPYTDKHHLPVAWGITPARWTDYPSHIHYALRRADGSLKYDYALDKDVKKVGGDPAHPTAADLVKLGRTKDPKSIAYVFPVQHVWDLEFWVVPNPKGAFAYKNPNVKPTTKSSM